MASENDVLGVDGAGEIVPACGVEWHVTPPTKATKAAFEAWMNLEARKRLLARKPLLPAMDFRQEWKQLTAAELRDDFAWGGTLFFDVVSSDRGGRRMTWLLLRQRHPDVTPELVEEILKEAGELLTWAVQAALRKADPALFSEPGPRPGAKAGGSEGGAGDTAATP